MKRLGGEVEDVKLDLEGDDGTRPEGENGSSVSTGRHRAQDRLKAYILSALRVGCLRRCGELRRDQIHSS